MLNVASLEEGDAYEYQGDRSIEHLFDFIHSGAYKTAPKRSGLWHPLGLG